MLNQFVKIRQDLHRIPEPGYQEFKTQVYLKTFLSSMPSDRLEIRPWKTGLFVKVKGLHSAKTIGYRADIDGLPIKEETGLPFLSEHEGYMHACGHDFHMSIALAVVDHFVQHPMNDDLVVLFQPAEEGPGGAKPMLNSAIMQEWMPDVIFALHIAPEWPVGTIATKPGLLFANTSELFIDLKGKGGHAAFPHHTNDMIIAACELVSQLQTIVARNLDPLGSAVVTIGKMTAGKVQNSIAETARLEGTIRTFSNDTMVRIKERIERIVEGIQTGFECHAEIDYGSSYYQVFNHEDLTKEFMQFLDDKHGVTVIECKAAMTGEDFGYILNEIPGFMFWLGVGSPFGLHHAQLNPDEAAINVAIETMTSYIRYKSS